MTRVGKAYLQRLKPNGSAGGKLKVQFNPTEYTITKSNHIAEVPIPGLDSPILQFIRGQSETMSLDLFFDSTEDGTTVGGKSVTALTDKFYDLIKMESKTHAPPILLFSWGGTKFPGKDRAQFTCICESVRQRYTLFDPAGVPLRATLSVTLKEYKTLGGQQDSINPMTSDHTKAHVTRDGETLAQIAYDEYDDPATWRQIADANNLDDPAVIPPGAILTIPRGGL